VEDGRNLSSILRVLAQNPEYAAEHLGRLDNRKGADKFGTNGFTKGREFLDNLSANLSAKDNEVRQATNEPDE